MCDPVRCADGFVYERAAITAWLQQYDTSPRTLQTLTDVSLHPMSELKRRIDAHMGPLFKSIARHELHVDGEISGHGASKLMYKGTYNDQPVAVLRVARTYMDSPRP